MKKAKRILIVIATSIALSGCETWERRPEWVCNCSDRAKIAEFVKATVKDANNMSDEEMEDVIFSLKWVAIMSYCHKELILQNGAGKIDYSTIQLDSCEVIM